MSQIILKISMSRPEPDQSVTLVNKQIIVKKHWLSVKHEGKKIEAILFESAKDIHN